MTKQELLRELSEGKTFNYNGFISGVFSNWAYAPFTVDGVEYPTSEHYFMAEKARFFNDEAALEKILKNRDPAEAKRIGHQVKNFDEKSWERQAEIAMYAANLNKFSQNPEIRRTLLNTGDDILVECSPSDLIWGAGIDIYDKRLSSPFEWPGLNKLGFTLMEVREALKQSEV